MSEDKTIYGANTISSDLLCDCFPEHCEKFEEHGLCWCDPKVIEINDSKIFVHQDEQ
jgi:hypothetical protein